MAAVACFASAAVGAHLADSYISRLSDHAGYFLVAGDDPGPAVAIVPPRHTVLIVADGLREDDARTLAVIPTLEAAGRCLSTDVGAYTVSRPSYSVMSTGLEADRTGSRDNDSTNPLAAESMWILAQRAGRRVTGISEVNWFDELFAGAFAAFETAARADDYFATAELADLSLVHPLYVDEASHDFGARAPEGRQAISRLDEELSRFMGRVDLSQDLVVLTADHGHVDRGGHGGVQPEVRQVLTCFAGPGIVRTASVAGDPTIPSRMIAAVITARLGLPFPKHMRAGDDDLETLWSVLDRGALPPGYVQDRLRAITKMRAASAARLAEWLGHPGATWAELYDREASRRYAYFGAMLIVLLIGWRVVRRQQDGNVFRALWTLAVMAVAAATYASLRGGLDMTSVNSTGDFVPAALTASGAAMAAGAITHALIFRTLAGFAFDAVALAAVALGVDLAHIVAFGWPLGFPLPSPELLFMPFLLSVFVAVASMIAAAASLTAALRNPG